jgi:hypothetical protein
LELHPLRLVTGGSLVSRSCCLDFCPTCPGGTAAGRGGVVGRAGGSVLPYLVAYRGQMGRAVCRGGASRDGGPAELASLTGVPASTVDAVLTRCGLNRLSHIDVATGEPARRYEHPHPGSMIHVDVKKLGSISDGGGWRYVGRTQGRRNRSATPGTARNAYRNPKLGHAYVHTVIDDHFRVAYAEVHDDEAAITATGNVPPSTRLSNLPGHCT